MAEPDDTGEGSRATEYTGPTGLVRQTASTSHQAQPALELDDETTDMRTPPPGSVRRATMPRASTPNPRFMIPLGEGSPVGEYEIQAQIGEGAMGTVYSAVHPLIGKTVAIKVLKPELCANQASIDRFVQEAQAVNRIGHPNIVDVFSLGELHDGRAYFVMEWLRGEDLKARLVKGPLSVDDTCEVLTSIAFALEAAHSKDVVHRDLKPDNVFLHQVDDGPLMVKLLDFGIAKLMREKSMEKTQTGNMLGTPRYISPEQARGVDVTHRSDIYSLGVMAYEMLSGRPPFTGETGMDLVVKHLNEPPPPLSQFVRVPRPLERCIMSMLAKDPADRPELAAVRRVLAEPTLRSSEAVIPRARRSKRRWIMPAAIAVVIGGGIATWQLMKSEPSPSQVAGVPTQPTEPSVVVEAKHEPAPPPQPVEPPAPERVAMAVTVKGAKDAVILVDGVEWGRGDALKMIEPGEHEVVARVKGKPPIKETVQIEAGQEVKQVTLTVPGATTQRPVRPLQRRPSQVRPPPPPKSDLWKPKGVK